jgi:glycosyltransferase involved in cell wall biosynthesis
MQKNHQPIGGETSPPIVIFTNTFPFETGETFLASELPYILQLGRPVILVPLYGSGVPRPIPPSPEIPLIVTPPLLSFHPKDKGKLLFYGLFNLAPFFFALNDFFTKNIWRSFTKIWRFATSWLLIRAALSQNGRLLHRLSEDPHPEQVTFYFYWGDKSLLLLPFLRHKGKTVVRFHGSDIYEEAHGIHPFRKRVLPLIDLACPISQHGADYLRKRYGAIVPPVSVSRLGTLDHGLGPEPIPNNAFHLVSCSHVIPLKRIDLIVEALLILHREQRLPRPVYWTHIGDGPLRNQLTTAIQNAGPIDRLTIRFCGEMPHDSVMQFYREKPVDLFLLTSRSEGVPVSAMEALSFGIPVMATAVGGVPELMSDNIGSLLPANPTPEEIASKLLEFISLPKDARNAIRHTARASWETKWNAEVNFKEFRDLLVQL